jgi:hypothetical protein
VRPATVRTRPKFAAPDRDRFSNAAPSKRSLRNRKYTARSMVEPKRVVAEIDSVLAEHRALRAQSKYDDCSDRPVEETMALVTVLASAAYRLSPPGSAFHREVTALMQMNPTELSYAWRIPRLAGLLTGLRRDFEAGRLRSLEEQINGAIFDDFLGEAERLQREKRLLPATVIAGVTLEEHIRKLADKNSIQALRPDGEPKKASTLNDELAKAGVYGKPDQSQVLSWLQLRNEAAHGDPAFLARTGPEIGLMISGIRGFLAKLPA